jgi:hypothetical protein
MGSCRQSADVWFYLFNRYGAVTIKTFFRDRLWRSPHFFHDSIGKYFNRIYCLHRNQKDVSDPGESPRIYCFRCERDVQ